MKSLLIVISWMILISFSCTNKWDKIPTRENCTNLVSEVKFSGNNFHGNYTLIYEKLNLVSLNSSSWKEGKDSFALVFNDSFKMLYHFISGLTQYNIEKYFYNNLGHCILKENYSNDIKTGSSRYEVLNNGVCFKETVYNNKDIATKTIDYLYEKENLISKRHFLINSSTAFLEQKYVYSRFRFKTFFRLSDILLNHKYSNNLPQGFQNGSSSSTITYTYTFTQDSLVASVNDNSNNKFEMKYGCFK